MNDVNGFSLVDVLGHLFNRFREAKAKNCLSSVCHQHVARDEDSNAHDPEVLILVMDAFGYSAEEILCHKQYSSLRDIFKKNFTVDNIMCDLAGSGSEGFLDSLYSTHESDVDYVLINKSIKIMTKQEYLEYRQKSFLFNDKNETQTLLRVEDDPKFPGYVKLLCVSPIETAFGIVFPFEKQYFSSYTFKLIHPEVILKQIKSVWEGTNGPARTSHWIHHDPVFQTKTKTDFVPCLEFKTWPDLAKKWTKRKRPKDWPSKEIMQKIKHEGCYFAPVGHFDSKSKDLQWRLSFCGEKLLLSELKPMQFYCFVALRIILKGDISRIDEDVLSSFHMKNIVYWCAEQLSCEWTINNFENCLKACIKALTKFVSSGKFPNYFIARRNMFNSKLTPELTSKILNLLQKYSNNVYEILSLDSLGPLKTSTLFKRPALELAIQKSVIYACIYVYWTNMMQVVGEFQDKMWTAFSNLGLLECLQKANKINHAMKSEKQLYLRHHILRSYIHSILGFLNYACYKTFSQNEYLPVARKHVVKSITFSNITLKCRAATFFFYGIRLRELFENLYCFF